MDMPVPRKWVAVTGHDTNPLPSGDANGLYCSVAGNIVCTMNDNAADVTITAVAGGYLWGKVTHVRATGTTATVFALY